MRPKFSIEIDVSSVATDSYAPRFANYGTIIAEGNNLDELLDNAQVDVMDQDGGELAVLQADSAWMQKQIEKAYHAQINRSESR
jgi:hypothetical protein